MKDRKYFFQYLPSSAVPVATVVGKDHPGMIWPATFKGLLQMARHLKKIGLMKRREHIGIALLMLDIRKNEYKRVLQ